VPPASSGEVPVAPTVAPVAVPPAAPAAREGRQFIAFYPGDDEQMLRFSAGIRNVRLEEEGGIITLRFRNA
jgi:hypothetical protein